MKGIVLALGVGVATLGFSGTASAAHGGGHGGGHSGGFHDGGYHGGGYGGYHGGFGRSYYGGYGLGGYGLGGYGLGYGLGYGGYGLGYGAYNYPYYGYGGQRLPPHPSTFPLIDNRAIAHPPDLGGCLFYEVDFSRCFFGISAPATKLSLPSLHI
jgi:hypothetical protein